MTRQRTTGRPGGGRFGGARSRYAPRRKVCFFCANKNEKINYKDADKLRGYISDRGKIVPRHRTGTCARHQRSLAVSIKRARHLALLPYVPAHMLRIPFPVGGPPASRAPAFGATVSVAPVTDAPASDTLVSDTGADDSSTSDAPASDT